MYIINTIKQEFSITKTKENNLFDERSVVDRHRCHMAAKFGVFVDEAHSKLPTLNFIKDPISHVLLLILVHVLLLSCL